MRTSFLCVLAGALIAGPALALPIETAYTIDAPLAITADGITATINPVDPLVINNGLDGRDTDCLGGGVCDIVNQDWLVFSVTVSGSGSLDRLDVGLLGYPPSNPDLIAEGLGYFLQGNDVQDGTGTTDTYTGSLAVPNTPRFTFVANGGGAGLTGTSLVLFVAYGDGVMPHITEPPFDGFGNNAVNFMVTPFGSASAASDHENFLTTVQVVPEPSTALLVGLGLLFLRLGAQKRLS